MGAGEDAGLNGPAHEQIRSCLERIVRNERFVHSRGLCQFLRYTIEETLDGRGGTLKESVLGPAVFGRRSDFDPRLDPIVRIQAGKVRTRLQQYYEAEGRTDDVIIEYQKGGYAPVFRPRPAKAGGVAARWPSLSLVSVAAAALFAAAALGAWLLSRPKDRHAASALEQLTSDTGASIFPAISRGGRLVVYSSDRRGSGDLDLWVKPVAGGEPVCLSGQPGADITPDFSPDGQRVVFRSNRKESGLYVVRVLGDEESRLTETGWRPRFSPDGNRIVYQGPGKRPGGGLWLISGNGGQPRPVEIRNQVELGGAPVWTPDSRYILFLGFDLNRSADWWLVSPEGGDAVRTGLAEQLRAQRLGDLNADSTPGDWQGEEMLFSLVRGATANLWLVPFSTRTWKVSGRLRQLTYGSGMELSPRVSAAGKVVFSGNTLVTHLWGVPLGAGDPRPLTKDSSLRPGHFRAVVRFSASDRFLAFASLRSGNSDIWLKDLESGTESALAGTSEPEEHPLFSPDGKTVAYVAGGARRALYVAEVERRISRKICDDCGEPYGWLPDSRSLLYGKPRDSAKDVATIDVHTGARQLWISRSDLSVQHATVSPDARWAMFVAADLTNGEIHLHVVPLASGLPDTARWTTVPSAEPEGPIVFAPSGDRIYYLASTDGFRCLWTHSFQPATGTLGKAEPLRHFHNNHVSPWNSWLWLASGQFVLAMTESTSNLWSFQLSR